MRPAQVYNRVKAKKITRQEFRELAKNKHVLCPSCKKEAEGYISEFKTIGTCYFFLCKFCDTDEADLLRALHFERIKDLKKRRYKGLRHYSRTGFNSLREMEKHYKVKI